MPALAMEEPNQGTKRTLWGIDHRALDGPFELVGECQSVRYRVHYGILERIGGFSAIRGFVCPGCRCI